MPVSQCALCFALQEVDAHAVREVCSKYFYDQCPAVAGLGKLLEGCFVFLFGPFSWPPPPPACTGSSKLRPLGGSAQ